MTIPADLSRLMDNARINAPGAIDTNIQLELFNTLDEFFRDTRCWLADITFATIVGTTSYTLVPTQGTIISLSYVLDSGSIPKSATMKIPAVVDLTYAPTQVETFTATVALNTVDPVDAAGYPIMPTWLLAKYGAYILSGVLSKLMSQPAKPYYNQPLAIFHKRTFRAGVASARAEARHKNLYGGQTWRFPGFATGRQR